VHGFAGKGDGNFNACEVLHAFGFGGRYGTRLTPNLVVVGQSPELHTVGFGARCQGFRRERAIGYHGVAMKVGVE
jgi:hypothetical protein